MTIDDNGEFRRRLLSLAELFDAKFSSAKQALYFEALRDVPFEKVAGALNAAAKSCTFMPRPAELRTLALGDAEDQAEQAWMQFREAMRRAGAMSSLVTADPALGETIVAVFGSWPEACGLELSQEMWSAKRKEFGRVYRVMRGRAMTGSRYLLGTCEAHNSAQQEWMKFTPVALVTGDDVQRLSPDEADAHRALLAAQAGFTRMEASAFAKFLPAQQDETA